MKAQNRFHLIVVSVRLLSCDRLRHAAQVAAHQRDVGGLHRHIGARADRDAHIGLRQRRRVVDAVADHRHDLALAPAAA